MLHSKIVQIWFATTIGILLTLVTIYIILHAILPGAEIIRLSKQEMIDINLILFGTNTDLAGEESEDNTTGDSVIMQGRESFDSLENNHSQKETPNPQNLGPPNTVRRGTVYRYLFSVRKPYSKVDSLNFVNYFKDYSPQQFAVVLSNYPIKVKSYFWLTERKVYLEIIFWTWFGLIASLLYSVSEALRTAKFQKDEIGVHIAKFFYAPICSIIIYFSINVLVSSGEINVSDFSHGTVVLSFILGFFSGRTIELLNKVKDLILPAGKEATQADKNLNKPEGLYTIEGSLNFKEASIFNKTLTAIKIQSLTEMTFNKIIYPDEEGDFKVTELKAGEYIIHAELKEDDEFYTGSEHVQLNLQSVDRKYSIEMEKYPLKR